MHIPVPVVTTVMAHKVLVPMRGLDLKACTGLSSLNGIWEVLVSHTFGADGRSTPHTKTISAVSGILVKDSIQLSILLCASRPIHKILAYLSYHTLHTGVKYLHDAWVVVMYMLLQGSAVMQAACLPH